MIWARVMVLIVAGFSALNAAEFSTHRRSHNLFASVFCGLVAISLAVSL